MLDFVVAPLAGSVDRNGYKSYSAIMWTVAPLAGNMDRNGTGTQRLVLNQVAPLAGSVDRNSVLLWSIIWGKRSPPSRGAWIEMGSSCHGRSFWLICAPFRLSRGAVLPGCTDGRAVPQPVGQGFPAASIPKFGRMQRFAALPPAVFGKKHQIPARVRRPKGTQPPAAGIQNRLKASPLPRLPARPAEKAFDKCRKMCIIMFRLKTKAFCPCKGGRTPFYFALQCGRQEEIR